MKKLFLLLVAFSCLYAVGQVNERATPDLNFHSKSATHSGNPTRQRKKEWRHYRFRRTN